MNDFDVPQTMSAVQLIGHGGFDQLQFSTQVPVPQPGPGEVLIKVGAAGINNTDINTRIGWYSKSVSGDTESGGAQGFGDENVDEDGSWSGVPLTFPRIQGADVCGQVVAVGDGVAPARVGERVLCATILARSTDANPVACWTRGSECDGGFAQYCVSRAEEALKIDCDWTDVELASLPCAYSTAENMLHRAQLKSGERVLITGASGGVGSAAIQLAKRRGAHVIALTSAAKADLVREIGADQLLDRDADIVAALGANSVDMVVDLVAGDGWPSLLEVLRPGGRYAVAGAIAGPMVQLDVRTLYLKDLSLFGSTYQPPQVFADLVGYVERGEIKPVVSKSYPLKQIAQAQEDFLSKKYFGKLVLVP